MQKKLVLALILRDNTVFFLQCFPQLVHFNHILQPSVLRVPTKN